MPDDWLSLSEVAMLLGVHPSTVRSWSNQGGFPVHRTQGGHRRYLRSEVDLWQQSQRTAAPNEQDLMVQKALMTTRIQISEGRLNSEAWYAKLNEEARAQYRHSSRTLLQGLLGSLVSDETNAQAEAHALGYEYATRGRRFGMSVADSVKAFLFFRNVLTESMLSVYEAASVRNPQAWSDMFRKVNAFTDQILAALLETYEALERGNSR
jgi:excisionase family DNA binding protein